MTMKQDTEEPSRDSLRRNGEALLRYAEKTNTAGDDGLDEAKRAREWVVKNLQSLQD
jgi:hypothetical protein